MRACAVPLAAVLLLAGCTQRRDETTTDTIEQAQAAAIAELRAVMSLHEGWPDVPQPAVNECEFDGRTGVLFTYFVTMESPDDPESLVRAAADHWRARNYAVEEFAVAINDEAGTDYTANARSHAQPHPSMSATDILAHIYVDTVCLEGEPDDHR